MFTNFTVLLLILITSITLYWYLKSRHSYWQFKGLDYLEPKTFYGNTKRLVVGELSFGEQFKQLYIEFKKKGIRKHGGIYMFFTPVYVPLDPKIIKGILQTDFDHFCNHGLYVNEKGDPLSGHLFNLEDERWKNIRNKVSSAFTSVKMKMMFPILEKCGNELETLLNVHSSLKDPVDIKEIASRFTSDVIGSCAFGLDCNSLKDPNNEFIKYGTKVFDTSFASRMRFLTALFIPTPILTKIGYKFLSEEVESFFINIVREIIEYRQHNKSNRKDFIQLLLEIKDDGEIDSKINTKNRQTLTFNELAAQCFGFFVAGFETSATTMSFALYELAINNDIQEKLRNEIVTILEKFGNELTYESIMEMTYLDKVVDETLRKYPPAPGIPRICNTAYAVPETDFVIEYGTKVHIPVMGLHHDPEYYPNPDVFDPDRFSEENKIKRPPCTYIPFGIGPRICVGARFGLLQTKIGLVSALKKFKVEINERTESPLRLDRDAFILGTIKGIWLNIKKIDE